MKVKIIVEPGREAPEAVLYVSAVTEEIRRAEQYLLGEVLNGYSGDFVTPLPVGEILRVYAENQKVYAQTRQGIFLLRQRLYELETMLSAYAFLRISNAEIVNSAEIQRLDISLTGTIGVELSGGVRTYASRRYVRRIKEYMGL